MRLVCELDPLPPGTHLVDELIIHVGADGEALAAPNRCAHQQARFTDLRGCVLTCGLHGWRLDASRMRYREPNGHMEQERYEVNREAARWRVYAPGPAPPWEEAQPRRRLIPGAFTVRWNGSSATVDAGGPGLVWPHDDAEGQELHRWRPLSDAARMMWLRQRDGGSGMLIELAGHRLMVLGAPLSLGTPKGVDVLLVASQDAIAAVSDAGPRAVVAGSAELASQLRGWLKGTPIWSTPHFDVGELRPR